MSSSKVKNILKEGEITNSAYVENKYIGKYKIIKTLGSGSSSTVVLAYNNLTEERVAIKIMPRNLVSSHYESNDERVFREIVISSLLNHPNIVRLLEFFYSSTHFFLVFEYVKGVQLYDIVLKKTFIPECEARKYFRQIISAIEYIHMNCVIHRDLKIENILVDQNDNIKIIDFGLSNFYNNKSLLKTFCGSLYFAAPELLDGKKYLGPEVDIWSLGVILYVMVCGKVPFDDDSVSNLQLKIKSGKFEFVQDISEEAKSLITKILVTTPNSRCTLKIIKDSIWINIGHKEKVSNYMVPRVSLSSINTECVEVLSKALSFQFNNVEEEIMNFYKICKDSYTSIDNVYAIRRPIVSMYYLLMENSNKKRSILTFKFKKKMDMTEIIYNFVKYIFYGEHSDIYKRYFITNIFQDNSSEKKDDKPIIWPCIRRSYVKGFFHGIKVKDIGSQNGFKKILLDIFKKYDIIYEVSERNYFCSYFDKTEECYFKISIYYNMIFGEYAIVLKCLNSKKNCFKTIYEIIQNVFKEKKLLVTNSICPITVN